LDGDKALFLAILEDLLDELSNVGKVFLGGEVQVLHELTLLVHEGKDAVVLADAAVLLLLDNGGGDVVARAEGLFVLIIGEDVFAGDNGFCFC
jgi:hypothetical protein